MAKIVIIGGSNIDIISKPHKPLIYHDSNIGDVDFFFGGVGRNIAENMSYLKHDVIFITALSSDEFGKMLINDLTRLNINIDHSLINDLRSGIYLAVCNHEGDMEVAICDNKIMDCLDDEFLKTKIEILNKQDYLLLDANITNCAIDYIFQNSKSHICVDPTSTVKAKKFIRYLDKIYLLKCNLQEAQVLTNSEADIFHQVEVLLKLGVKNVIITQGSLDLYYNVGLNIFSHSLKRIDEYKSTTGCGDAFMSGIMHGILTNKSIPEAIDFAISVSELTLQVEGACNANISKLIG